MSTKRRQKGFNSGRTRQQNPWTGARDVGRFVKDKAELKR